MPEPRDHPRDLPSAILACYDVDNDTDLCDLTTPTSDNSGESHLNAIVFSTPCFDAAPSIDVFDSCIMGTCDCIHLIGGVPCQLKPCRWAPLLFGTDAIPSVNDDERMYLWRGVLSGFNIVDDNCPSSYVCDNYNSILESKFRKEMTDLLRKELLENKVSVTASPPRCIHALGAVVKANGKLRPITDCSRPDNVSINNYMLTTFETFSYKSVEDAVQVLDHNDHMCVVDISSAYRSVNVNPSHANFQGLSWDFGDGPTLLIDRRLCFGLRCAPRIFNSLSNFIMEAANHLGALRVINYLDDFLVIAPTAETALSARQVVTDLLQRLGFEVSWAKVSEPDQVTTFLGITIDSVKMELSLPLEKVEKLRSLLLSLIAKKQASKKELERVGGLVSHCSYVIKGGRTFSRRIFDLAALNTRSSTIIPLGTEILADFEWWLAFCYTFNGRACIIKGLHPVPITSDSSFKGFGAWAGCDWIAGFWDPLDIPPVLDFGCSHLTPPSFV